MHRTAPFTDFDSIKPILSELRIFGGVTDPQLAAILRRLELWVLPAGEVVFQRRRWG